MSRLPLVALVAFLALAAWWYYTCQDTGPPPVEATCRQLADSPALFAGKPVRVSTAGARPDGRGGLAWRRESHLPPAVVLRGRIPEPVPPHLVGVCHAPRAGGPVTVTDCEP